MAMNLFEGARRITQLVSVVWVVGISLFTLMQGDPYITSTYYVSASDRKLGPSDPSCRYLSHFRQDGITVKTKKGTEAHVTLCFPPETKEFDVTVSSGNKYALIAPVVASEQEVLAYAQSEVDEFANRHRDETKATKQALTPRDEPETLRHLENLESVLAQAKAARNIADVKRLETEVANVKASLPALAQKRTRPPHGFRDYEPWRDDPIIWDWNGQAFAEHIKNTLVLSQTDEEWIDTQWWMKWWEAILEGCLVLVAGIVSLRMLTWSIGWIVCGFLGIPRGQDHKMV